MLYLQQQVSINCALVGYLSIAQMIDGEVYDVDDALLAWMDSFEGHPEVYERGKISVRLLSPPTTSVAPTPSFQKSSSSTSSNGDTENRSIGRDQYKTRSAQNTDDDAVNSSQIDLKKNKADNTGEDVMNAADECGEQTCSCWVYFLKQFPAELVRSESYAVYDAFGIKGKPYQPE